MKSRYSAAAFGFSMIEVLVTIVVVSVGLLGLSKMQAAAISNTQVSRIRSLISLQAASLAAAMHGNVGYWGAAGTAPASLTISGDGVISDSGLNGWTTDCSSVVCTSAQVASYDLKQWGSALNKKFPSYTSTINCSTVSTLPVSCNINLSWAEKYVAINKSTAKGSSVQTSTQSYTLYVEP
jgi:type IV pilus assembly protein PilV